MMTATFLRNSIIGIALLFYLPVLAQVTEDDLSVYKQLCREHVCHDYKLMYRNGGEGAFRYPFLTPGSKSYSNVLWDWDSWLSNVALRQILALKGNDADRREAVAYEQGCVLNFLTYTDVDGYMPIGIDQNTDPKKIRPKDVYHTNMHKPVIAQHAAFLTQQSGGDAQWLAPYFGRMEAFINCYRLHHRHAETGLFYWQDDMAIGVDTDPSTFFRPTASSASIMLNCLMYRELLAMQYLATQLGRDDRAVIYSLQADTLKHDVQRFCWDERDGMYYSVDINLLPAQPRKQTFFGHPFMLHEGGPRSYPCLIQRIGSWAGFMAMWAGIATPEQARRMVRENLLDERTFCAPYGVRTLSKQEAMYNLDATHNPSNWNGPVWGISNYMVFRGLVRYGMNDEARAMAHKTILLYGRDLMHYGSLHEYYNPDTGEGIINPDFQNWNYLVINMIAWLDNLPLITEF